VGAKATKRRKELPRRGFARILQPESSFCVGTLVVLSSYMEITLIFAEVFYTIPAFQ
jgi:hypothetical protein